MLLTSAMSLVLIEVYGVSLATFGVSSSFISADAQENSLLLNNFHNF